MTKIIEQSDMELSKRTYVDLGSSVDLNCKHCSYVGTATPDDECQLSYPVVGRETEAYIECPNCYEYNTIKLKIRMQVEIL
jgi:hypothetical protein